MKRRQFLSGAAGLALASRLPGLAWAISAYPKPTGFVGGWYSSDVPDSAEYLEAIRVYNPRFTTRPSLIASVANDNDVALAIRYAKQKGLKIAIRGAGHSYEALSLGPDLVIDTRALSTVEFTPEGKLRVGSGCRFRQVLAFLEPQGLAIPFGSCPGVGVAGYSLGGGISLLSRSLGLGCDRLTAVDLVDAKGRAVRASAAENPELFWALRGAGSGNFGVVTALEFETTPIGQVVLFRRVFPAEQAKAALLDWQDWMPQSDQRVGSHATLRGGPKGSLRLGGVFNGPLDDWNQIRSTSLFSDARRTEDSFDRVSSLGDALRYFGGNPKSADRATSPFQATCDFVQKALSDDWISNLLNTMKTTPFATILLDALGGRIDEFESEDCAYVHRAGNHALVQALVFQSNGYDQATVENWLRGYRKDFGNALSGFAYQNYPDNIRDGWEQAFYGSNLELLKQLKRQWDPSGLFKHARSL